MMMLKKASEISLASLKTALSTCSFLSPLMIGLLSMRRKSRFSLQACSTFFISAYTCSSRPLSKARSSSDLAYLDATFVPCICCAYQVLSTGYHDLYSLYNARICRGTWYLILCTSSIQIHILQQAFHQLLLFFGG